MYFLNTRNEPEFAMYATRKEAEIAKDAVGVLPADGETTITQRFLTESELLETFPFIRNVDYEKTTDWGHPVFCETGTALDCIPNGWQKPWIMETMLMSLKSSIQEDGLDIEKVYMTDAKEKYGSLRMDFSAPATDGQSFSDMCYAWEALTGYFCCMCGKPHVSISHGWICPYCKDCWDDANGPFAEIPLENLTIIAWKDDEKVVRSIELKPLFDKVTSVLEDTDATPKEAE